MDLSINLINSSESSLASQQQFLRNLPVDAKVEDLSLESLQLLVYYLFKQGPYELASLRGFKGTLEEWLQSLKSNLKLKAYVKTYKDLQTVSNLEEGDLVYVQSTSKVYLYSQGSFQEEVDGLVLTGASAYDIAVGLGFTGTAEEWLQTLKGDKFIFEDFTGEELELLKGDKGDSAYQVAIQNGFVGSEKAWLESIKGTPGEKGATGLKGEKGEDGSSAYQLAVQQGFKGTLAEYVKSLEGLPGEEGKSAYALALSNGFQGSLEDFLESLRGLSAYESDVLNGFKGTEQEWLNSLQGASAYSIAKENGFKGSSAEFVESLKGLSAYSLAKQQGYIGTLTEWLEDLKAESPYQTSRKKGFEGTEEEWLESLKGYSAYSLALQDGYQKSLKTWLQSLKGMSAYEIAVAEGYKGTPVEWLRSLRGSSAYSLAVQNGFEGSEKEFLNSLKGAKGLSAYEVSLQEGFVGSFEEWKESLRGYSPYEIAVNYGYEGSEEEWSSSLALIKESVYKNQNILNENTLLKDSVTSFYKNTQQLNEEIEKLYLKILENASNTSLHKEYVSQVSQNIEEYFSVLNIKYNSVAELLKEANNTTYETNKLLQRAEDVLVFTKDLRERLTDVEKILTQLPSFKEEILLDILSFKKKLIKNEILLKEESVERSLLNKKLEVLIEDLPTLLKSYEYIITETGISLKEFLKDLENNVSKKVVTVNGKEGQQITLTIEDIKNDKGVSQQAINEQLEETLEKRVQSVNGKEGLDIFLNRQDVGVPSDEELSRLKKEDLYVLLENGKTLREFNSIINRLSIYPEMFGSTNVQGYSSTMFNNMIAALNTTFASTPVTVELRNDYKIDRALNPITRGNIRFKGVGTNTLDISSSPTTGSGYIFTFQGLGKSIKTTVSKDKNISFLDKSVVVNSSEGFAIGDWISITSSGEYWNGISGAGGYGVYFKGELSRIKSIEGNTLNLMIPIQDTYDTSSYTVNVTKISMLDNISFEDFLVLGHGRRTFTTSMDVSKFTSFANADCVTNLLVNNVNFREVVTDCFFQNVGFYHTFINCSLINTRIVTASNQANSPNRLGMIAAPYGVSEVKFINCNSTSCRRLMNMDQSKYAWVNSENPQESIHSKGVLVLGGNSYDLFNAVGGHQYYNLQVIGHNAIGCLTGIQHRGKKLTVSNCNLETDLNGIVLGVGSSMEPSSYTEDPTVGDVVIDSTTTIISKVRGVWATQSWDTLTCEAKINAPIAFRADGKRQSNALIVPKFTGDGSNSAIQLTKETGLLSRENFYVKGGYIHNFTKLATVYGKTSGTATRNIDFENISCLGISDCYLDLPSTTGYTSAITLVNCTSYSSTATSSVRTLATTSYTSLGNSWELTYPHVQSILNNTITIYNQNDVFMRVDSSDTTNTPVITELLGGREGQKIFLQCYSPLTSITFNSSTTGLSLKTGTTLTIPRGGWIELVKTGSNTWSEINNKSS